MQVSTGPKPIEHSYATWSGVPCLEGRKGVHQVNPDEMFLLNCAFTNRYRAHHPVMLPCGERRSIVRSMLVVPVVCRQ